MSKVGRGSTLNVLIAVAALAATADIAEAADVVGPSDAEPAADDASISDADIGQVIVSARRREEKAEDVPIPIATLSGADLEASGQSRLENLNEHLPSTNIEFTNPRQTSIAVRGLGNNPADDGLESSVGVYMDGVYLGRASMANVDLADLDQVELLRGPQGTLFGKNTTAGVINITTRLPSFNPELLAEGTYGNLGYYQAKVAASDALIGDTLAGRISFVRTFEDGFVHDPITGQDYNGINRSGGRAQLLWKPNSDLTVRFIADDSSESENSGAAVLYSAGPNGGQKYYNAIAAAGATVIYDPDYETTTLNGRQHMRSDNTGYSLQADWKTGDYTITSITAYRSWFFQPDNDADGTNLDAFRDAGQRVRDHQESQELRLVSPELGPIDFVAGFYWFEQQQHNDSYTQYGSDALAIGDLRLGSPVWADGQVATRQHLRTESDSVFGQLSYKPVAGLELTGGLRDTYEQKSVSVAEATSGVTNSTFSATYPTESIGPLARYDNDVSALLSASYKFTPNVLGYLSVSRGVKSGAIDPRIPSGGLPVSTLYVAPELAKDAELGLKSTLLDRRLTWNANLFWTQVYNYQTTLLEPPSLGNTFVQVLSNIPGVRTRGVETELQFRPVQGLSLDLTGSFNDARYTDYSGAPCSAEALLAAGNLNPGQNGFSCNLTGKHLVGAPTWILNPAIQYSWNLPGGATSTAAADYAWRSWFYGSADDSNLARVPSYGLFNLRWSFESELGKHPLSVALWSHNLFDKRYVVGGLSTASALYAYSEMPGAPRTYGLTLSWSL